MRQVEDIQLISRTVGFESLSDGLAQIARLRLKYPDATLKELGMMLNPDILQIHQGYVRFHDCQHVNDLRTFFHIDHI